MHKDGKYAGAVWILSSASLFLYGTLVLFDQRVPGVEELVAYLASLSGAYIYGAAFLSIFIEGLYVVGSFFPGSTLVLIMTLLSQAGGTATYIATVLAVFLGWCAAGAVNIIAAKYYGVRMLQRETDPDYRVVDRAWATWFPAFRANYEVAQVAEGGDALRVFFSSLRVKLLASCAMLVCLTLMGLLIDIHNVSNEEGVLGVFVVATISFIVGALKIRKYVMRG